MKVSTHQKDVRIITISAPNSRAHKYMKQTLTGLKGETDSKIILVGNFNTPLSEWDSPEKRSIWE